MLIDTTQSSCAKSSDTGHAFFVNVDGTPKIERLCGPDHDLSSTTCWSILTRHQFRHLSAKVVLDKHPGEFETVNRFLGHKSIKPTVAAYAGVEASAQRVGASSYRASPGG